jgi:hypothetical protein
MKNTITTQWFFEIVGGSSFLDDKVYFDSTIADNEEQARKVMKNGYDMHPSKFKLLYSKSIELFHSDLNMPDDEDFNPSSSN